MSVPSLQLLRVTAVLACLPAWPGAARADTPEPAVELEGKADWISSCSLDGNGSRVSQTAFLLDASLPVAGGQGWGIGMDLVGTRRTFHFERFDRFIPGAAAPFESANDLSLQPVLALMPNPAWTWLVGANLEYAGAVGADFNKAFLASYSAAGLFEASPQLKVGFGCQLRQRFPRHRYLMPFPLLDWHYHRWSLVSMDGETGRLSFAISSNTDLYAQVEFRSFDVRFGPGSPLAAGILHCDVFPAVLGVHIKVNKHFMLSVSSGLALTQQLRFEDQHGRFLKESDTRSPFCGNFDASWCF